MDMCVQAVRELDWQIRLTISSCDGEGNLVPKFLIRHCREKPLVRLQVPVPITDTGRHGEYTKGSGRTLVKEVSKITSRVRENGRYCCKDVTWKRSTRLFIYRSNYLYSSRRLM